jgi:hypothetical protein
MLRLERFLLADEQSFVPRSLASVDRTYRHSGSSAIPPSASLCGERIGYTDREVRLSLERTRDQPLLARSGQSASEK